ncbi:MAG: ribonuclease III, partial [Flavonifractor sp.]|nr:ribonuclease III [Flavonifractor sp.]
MTDYFQLSCPPDKLQSISTLGLAHLGDGVFELMVRSWLCLHGKATNAGL